MSAQTTYPKRNLEVIPFSYQLEFIDKVVSSPTKSQHQSSNRYHNNNNNNHHHHHQNQHLHLHQQYQQCLQQQQQQNKYTLAAVAAAAALQQQQQQTFLLQQQQAQQAALAQKKQQQQQQQKQTQHQHSQLFVNYNSQSPQVFALPTPPQVFGDVPMDKSITNSSMFSSLSQPLNTTGNIDLKTNFMLYNNSTNSIPSPTISQYGGNGGGGKQTSASSQSSGGAGAAVAATSFTTKLFDNSVGSNSNSPILLPPNANRNPSPPNLFLSTNSSNNNNGSPLMGASMTPTSTSFLNNSPSLVTTGPISSNTWSMGVSTPTSGSIWGNKSSGTSTTLTATPITKTSSNVMSSFNGSNLW